MAGKLAGWNMRWRKQIGLAVFLLVIGGIVQAQPPARAEGKIGLFTHQWRDADNYYLGILLNGIAPDQLEVTPRAGTLVIKAQQQKMQRRDGGFASSSQAVRRSFALPRDADIQNMWRKITGRDVVIVIPRRRR